MVGGFINIMRHFPGCFRLVCGVYAGSIMDGMVTSTARRRSSFVYLIALGVLVYSLVLLVRSIIFIKAANNK